MIVKLEPFTVEFGVIYVMSFMDVCADVGYYGEEIVGAISEVVVIGNCVGGVGRHV
jgi:hypothetical protein